MCVFWFFVLCLRSGLSEFLAVCLVLICEVFQALFFESGGCSMVKRVYKWKPVNTTTRKTKEQMGR